MVTMKDIEQADENVWLDRMQLHADPLADNTMADHGGVDTPGGEPRIRRHRQQYPCLDIRPQSAVEKN